jgi:hypothetical protein
MSALMDGAVTVPDGLATDLGLDRFAVPGGARLQGTESETPIAPFRKVRIRLGLRALGFDEEVIAVVVPGRTVESAIRSQLAATVKIEVRPVPAPEGTIPRTIDAPEEVKRIVDAAIGSLVPSASPAGGSSSHEIRFIRKDGTISVASLGPGVFGVRLPEGTRTKDYALSAALESALRPYFALEPK